MLAGMFLFASCVNASKSGARLNDEEAQQEQGGGEAAKHLTKAEFKEKVFDYENAGGEWKYLGDRPAIVDFYATWCGPCKKIAPVLEKLAKEYDGKIYVYKVDTDRERELAAAFGIRSIPTLLFIPMEGDPQVAMGALPEETLKEAVDNFLLKADGDGK